MAITGTVSHQVTSSRNVADSSVTCAAAADPSTGQTLISTAVNFPHPNSLVDEVVVHADHVNPSLAHLTLSSDPLSSTAPTDHLMRFTDELSISMKPNLVGSPLVDDEDDDVRSLLAAAAAVAAAASPTSPQLRSSSSGLNTPPHTRVCNALDNVASDSVKDGLDSHEHGLHTPGGAALLVSRLNSTAAAFATSDTNDDDDDPLSMLIPSTVSQHHNSLTYPSSLMVCTPPTSLSDPCSHLSDVSNPPPVCTHTPVAVGNQPTGDESRFRPSCTPSPATPCDSPRALDTHPMGIQFQTSLLSIPATTTTAAAAVTLNMTEPTNKAAASTGMTAIPSANFVPFSPGGAQHPLVSTPQPDSHFPEFISKSAPSNVTRIPNLGSSSMPPHSPTGAISDVHITADPTTFISKPTSACPSPQGPVIQRPDTIKPAVPVYSESTHTNVSHDDVDCGWTQSPTTHAVLLRVSPGHHPSVAAEDEFDACSPSATAENLKDLEQVISSHSASLPATDDCDDELYLLKTSPFDLATTLKTDTSSLKSGTKPLVAQSESELVPSKPAPSLISSDSGAGVTSVSPKPIPLDTQQTILVVDSASVEPSVDQSQNNDPTIQDMFTNTPTSVCASDALPLVPKDTSVVEVVEHEVSQEDIDFLLPVDPVHNDSGSPTSPLPSSPDQHTSLGSTGVQPVCEISLDETTAIPEVEILGINSVSSVNINGGATSEPEADEVVVSEPVAQSKLILGESEQERTVEEGEEVYDEEEYVNAAVAAVDDVVFALAGNRKPDPSLEIDPALEGTGTDRIFTLSLAPVHRNEPPVCSVQSICSVNAFALNSAGNNGHADGSNNLLTVARRSVSFPSSTVIAGSLSACTPYAQSRSTNATDNSGMQSDFDGTPVANPTGNTTNNATPTVVTANLNWDQRDGNGDYLCPACPRVFPQKALLLKHRVVHDEPKHFCDTCGRCFVREDKLKRHVMSIHTAEKPHVCHICTKAFSRKDKLKDHLKHHDRAARNFECQQCQQPFVQKSDLNRHIRGVHQGEPGIGINMGTKRRAPGLTPAKPSKKKSKSLSAIGDSVLPKIDPGPSASIATSTTASAVPAVRSTLACSNVKTANGKLVSVTLKKGQSNVTDCQSGTAAVEPTASSTMTGSSIEASIAAAAAAAASLGALPPTANPMPPGNHHHPVFAAAAAASGFMLPTMALTQAHQQFVQQHQQQQQQQQAAAAAAAAAAAMLPTGTAGVTPAHQSAVALQQQQQQQQQQQFFTMTNGSQSSAATVVTTNPQQAAALAHSGPAQTTVHVQPELKTVATPNGPMMVLTRIAAATNQTAGQTQQLTTGQAMFPQMVGFHTSSAQQQQQQQLQQLQQQAAVVQHQQLLQQQQQQQATVNNCYQLAAALYQQHHPGLMLAAANGGVGASAGAAGSTVAAMALHQQQQQQQYQQQQHAGLMAAYHQHQQAAHQHALQQQQ
ncbi:unnamed protein product [Echinostoma caproni]|uniref:C2H2-type domain-containing protein n=1 Tax=Echinostoma caproni TaxID=27848 RepID=A0A183ADG7_9TREM|nr:unnamed protein product [Echinostoma caproni]